MGTPNARSKEMLEAEGFVVAIVEKYNTWAQVRNDLFGFADLLAVRSGVTLAVQATTDSNLAARRTKLRTCETVSVCLAAGWQIEIHGWAKRANRWRCRREKFEEARVTAG